MEYRPPAIEGLQPLWGDTVFHCPFCHGWEVNGLPLAVLGEGDQGDHLERLLGAWSDDVVRITRPIKRLIAHEGKLQAIEFEDGETLARSGLLVETTFHQRSDLAAQLGAETADNGLLAVDAMAATTVPGLYAAGDVSGKMPSVANAIASGSVAAARAVGDG
jgi:thioredoxin reductase